MRKTVKVLHLSDLHFGMEPEGEITPTDVDRRNLALDGLTGVLKGLEGGWRPDVVAISGDIAWKAQKADYQKATDWLTERLLATLGIPTDKLVICAGNHDIERSKTMGMLPPRTASEADEWLKLEHIENFSRPFGTFVDFCNEVGSAAPMINGQVNRLAGTVEVAGLRFVVLNSAWFCRGDEDGGKLWLGKPLIEKMAAGGQLIDPDRYDASESPLTIALYHHPNGWFDEAESHTFDSRFSTAEYLGERTHIVLNGHVHARPAEPDRLFNTAWRLKGGAMYVGHTYRNHFAILKIDTAKRTFCRQIFEFDPGRDRWESIQGMSQSVYDLKRPAASSHAPHLVVPLNYKKWVRALCRMADITKLASSSPVFQVGIPQIYIPLMAYPPESKRASSKGKEHIRDAVVDIEDLISQGETLVIEGRAGSGKTTLVKHFAFQMMDCPDWKGLDGFLPVLMFLGDLKDFDTTGLKPNSDSALKVLAHWSENTESNLDVDTIQDFCEAGKAVFFLDGLDEIEESLRAWMVNAFHKLALKYDSCRFVLSGRPHGVDDTVRKWFGQRIVQIQPLVMQQVEAFIHKWFRFVLRCEECGLKKTARDMIGEIKIHSSISELVDSPLMLTAICLLYCDHNELPGQRAELYDRFIRNLLHKRFPEEAHKVRSFLMNLAAAMHDNRAEFIDRVEAIELLGKEYKKTVTESAAEYRDRLNEKFNQVEPGCGLLTLDRKGYAFIHLTFQEFFKANDIVEKETGNYFNAIQPHLDDTWYREVTLLYIGLLSDQSSGVANEIVRQIVTSKYNEHYYNWLLAARALIDIHKDKRRDETVEKVIDRLWQIIGSTAGQGIRAEAGRLVGRIGDQRNFDLFVSVANGKYDTSTGSAEINAFEIGEYTVTNSWYRQFIDAGGYHQDNWQRFWSPNGIQWLQETRSEHQAFWFDYKWNCANHPVVGVCWYEAAAFCRWLTASRQDGFTYRLPTERQWEAAAAGKKRRKYPWGQEFDTSQCNTSESEVGRTSAVGIFAGGQTPEGVCDLAGNVWEWTNSEYHSKENFTDFRFDRDVQVLFDKIMSSKGNDRDELINSYRKSLEEKDRQLPVLRGGSWDFDRNDARCDNRVRGHPINRDVNVGFRCSRTKN